MPTFAGVSDVTPEEFAQKINARAHGTMIEAHGPSVNLIRNASHGTLTAEAQIVHRGRTTLVVEVSVFDWQRRLIAKLVVTQLAPAAPPATAPAGRPGR